MSRTRTIRLGFGALLCLGLVLVGGCLTDGALPTSVQRVQSTPAVMDMCWPPSADCQHRELNTNEHNRVVSLSMNINVNGDPMCSAIMNQSLSDTYGNIKMWTDGPTGYEPEDFFGDRHNVPQVTHLTANAFANNSELMRTLIHEACHAIGNGDDDDCARLEEACFGDIDI